MGNSTHHNHGCPCGILTYCTYKVGQPLLMFNQSCLNNYTYDDNLKCSQSFTDNCFVTWACQVVYKAHTSAVMDVGFIYYTSYKLDFLCYIPYFLSLTCKSVNFIKVIELVYKECFTSRTLFLIQTVNTHTSQNAVTK